MQLTRRLDSNYDMTFGQGLLNFCQPLEGIQQNVTSRLYLIQGEWFLDTDAGIPYLGKVTAKPADLSFVEASVKAEILDADDIVGLEAFSLSLNHSIRELTIEASAVYDYNDDDTTLTVPLQVTL